MPTPSSVPGSADIIEGAEAIAEFLWGDATKARKVYHLYETKGAPIFKLGGRLSARRSTLIADIERRERAAQPGEVAA